MPVRVPSIQDGDITLLEREIIEIPVIPAGIETVTLRMRPNLLRRLMLHMTFTIVAPIDLCELVHDMPWGLIRRLTVHTPRGDILKSVTGQTLHFLNSLEFGSWSDSTVPFEVEIEQTYTGTADLIIPFENHTGANPERTELNTNEFTEIYVTIHWGIPIGMYNPNATSVAMNCHVYSLERDPLDERDQLAARQKMIDLYQIKTLTGSEEEILLVENTDLKTILLVVRNSSKIRIDDLLQRVQVVDSDYEHVIRDLSGSEIQSIMKSYYHVEDDWNALSDDFKWPYRYVGIYCIEFDQIHDLSALYRTKGKNYPKLVLNFDPEHAFDGEVIEVLTRQIKTPPV